MKLGFLFHIYQPPLQSDAVVKSIAETSYLPLIKLLKKRREFKLTLNIPLSLLEHLDRLGYLQFINDLKELIKIGQVELVGSGAYHALLTKQPQSLQEEQIILQEYCLGYYFGSRIGFDGEDSVMIKDIRGFFPPEIAINSKLLNVLDDLSYNWVAVDSTAFDPNSIITDVTVYKTADHNILLVKRNTKLSNSLSFQRDSSTTNFMDGLLDSTSIEHFIALDGETFGHHNKEGLFLLDSLLDDLLAKEVELTTITELISGVEPGQIDAIKESTWGASVEDMANNIPYPMWATPGNAVHANLWKLLEILSTNYKNDMEYTLDGYENVPLWSKDFINSIEDPAVKKQLKSFIDFHKLLASDAFWWASNKHLPNNVILSDSAFVNRYLDAVSAYVSNNESNVTSEEVNEQIAKIREMFNV